MSRRHILVVSSSDSDKENEQQQDDDVIVMSTEDISVNISSNPMPQRNLYAAFPNSQGNENQHAEQFFHDISDEDEDVTNREPIEDAAISRGFFEVSESPISGVLERLGLRLRREWLNSCLHELESTVHAFQRMENSMKAKLCFSNFLHSDINYCGAGVLPPNIHGMHMVDLSGPFVLQVDEIVNISCPLRGRYQNAVAGIKRCLKLSMTDGVQRVFGMEYRPIKDLEALAPAGLKVAISNVNIRHGLLVLVPEVVEVLGGIVEDMEAARTRVVNGVNKPPRGRRKRTSVVTPLVTLATLVAWPPSNDVNADFVCNSNNIAVGVPPLRANEQAEPRVV